MREREELLAFEAIPFDDDADEVQTWKGLALSAVMDLRRYADDELPHRRMVSARAYEADAVRIHAHAQCTPMPLDKPDWWIVKNTFGAVELFLDHSKAANAFSAWGSSIGPVYGHPVALRAPEADKAEVVAWQSRLADASDWGNSTFFGIKPNDGGGLYESRPLYATPVSDAGIAAPPAEPVLRTTAFDEVTCAKSGEGCEWPECDCPRKTLRGTFACPICGDSTPHFHSTVSETRQTCDGCMSPVCEDCFDLEALRKIDASPAVSADAVMPSRETIAAQIDDVAFDPISMQYGQHPAWAARREQALRTADKIRALTAPVAGADAGMRGWDLYAGIHPTAGIWNPSIRTTEDGARATFADWKSHERAGWVISQIRASSATSTERGAATGGGK